MTLKVLPDKLYSALSIVARVREIWAQTGWLRKIGTVGIRNKKKKIPGGTGKMPENVWDRKIPGKTDTFWTCLYNNNNSITDELAQVQRRDIFLDFLKSVKSGLRPFG